jgi:hypothetical protein
MTKDFIVEVFFLLRPRAVTRERAKFDHHDCFAALELISQGIIQFYLVILLAASH